MFTSHETDFANGGKGNPRAGWSLHFSSILSILPNFIHFIDYFSFEAQLYQIPMLVSEFCHSNRVQRISDFFIPFIRLFLELVRDIQEQEAVM